MGKKIALIALAALALLSCENPIQSGLGPKVDITVPVITMEYPQNVGDHVKGELNLQINAKDDIGVSKVQVAVTRDAEGNPLPEGAWVWKDAVLDPVSGLWTYPLDTTAYPDGDLPVMIRAEDATGKSVIFEAMYSSKNGNPEVELQIPAMPEDPARRMELVTGGVMIGIAKDLWGVAPGYPKIQFWPVSEGENPADPAAWQLMDTYASRTKEEWAAATSGRTALEFQFHAVNRSDPSLALDKMPSLQPGTYRFRFQVKDIAEDSDLVTYPETGYYELDVIAVRELPLITITAKTANDAPLEGQYHRDPFYIAADVSHTTGIYEARLEVQKEGDEKGSVLAREIYTENKQTGSEVNTTMTRQLASYLIYPGKDKYYEHTDVDTSDSDYGAVASYPFTDGIYTFTIQATSYQTSYARQSLTVYIDTKAPEISVTRVQPTVDFRHPDNGGLDEYTVNGYIAVDMSYYDANNIGSYVPNAAAPTVSYREIKYLIRDAEFTPPTDSAALHTALEALYDSAPYFDSPAAPVYRKSGSTAQLIIDTTHSSITPGAAFYTLKNKYLHFIAKDRAGNYGYTAALLKVDQSTDIPKITITNFDFAQRSPALLAAVANPNRLLDADRVLSGTFTDDDGVLINTPGTDIKFVIYKDDEADNNVPKPIEAAITVTKDNLDVLNDGKIVNFTVSLPPAPETAGGLSDATHLADGTYSVEIEVKDSPVKNDLKPVTSMAPLKEEVFNTTNIDTATPKRHIYFVLDTQPPVLTETEVGDTTSTPKLVAGKFSLKGLVTDVNGLRSLRITQTEAGVENSAKTVFNEPDYKASKSEDWEVPDLPVIDGVLKPGTFTYEITAMDVAQRTTNLTRQVVVDTEPPVLTITQPAEGAWVTNSTVVVRGTETDNYRTGPVFYHIAKVLPTDPAAPQFKATPAEYRADGDKDTDENGKIEGSEAYRGWQELPVQGNDWNGSVDNFQTASLGEGNFYLYVAAFDAAGHQVNNETSVRSFGVDYNLPYIDNWDKTSWGIMDIDGSYYSAGSYNFSFDAKDSNALKSVVVRRDGAPVTTGLSVSPAPGPGVTSSHVSLNHTGTNGGIYSYVMEITDIGNQVNNLENTSGATANAFKQITVRVDTQGPNLSVSSPGADTPLRLTSDQLPVQGTAPDSGIPTGVRVYYAVDTSATKAELNKPGAGGVLAGWTLLDTALFSTGTNVTLTTTMAAEGERYVHFIAYDQLGNQSDPVDRKFYVDHHAPQINGWTSALITKKPSDTPSVNLFKSNAFGFEFIAHDTNGIKDVRITRGGTALPYVSGALQPDPVQGDYTVTVTKTAPQDAQHWKVEVSFTGQKDGDYAYGVEIEDIAGRINPANNTTDTENGVAANAFKAFNVTVDTTPPTVNITTPGIDALVLSQELVATGTVTDATADGITVWYVVDDGAPITTLPVNPSTEAEMTAAGWAKATDNWSGTATLIGKPEGYLFIRVIAYDKLWNGNSAPLVRRFSVDYSPPQILEFAFTGAPGSIKTFPGDPVTYAQPAYGFTFKANDSNALSGVVVTRDGTPLTSPEITLNPSAPFPTGTKTIEVTVNLSAQPDGNYPYIITITDTAGQTNTNSNTDGDSTDNHNTFSVRVDTAGPVLAVNSPADGAGISGDVININGTATDLTTDGLSVWFKVDAATSALAPASTTTAPSAGWLQADYSTNWLKDNVSLTTVGEGTRYVHFVGFDKLGNVGAVTDKTIYYDAYPPYIKDWDPEDVVTINESYYAKGPYTLKFDAYDSNALYTGSPPLASPPPATVQVKATTTISNVTYVYDLAEGTHSELGGYILTITKTDSTNKTWPVELELTNPADGNISYEFIITDARGNTNTQENLPNTNTADQHKRITVRTDKQGPSISVAEPYAGLSITGDSLQSSGNATDTGIPELIPVYYKVTNAVDSVSVPAVAADAGGEGWTLATTDASWTGISVTLGTGVNGQGEKRIHFVAYDQLDNSTLVSQPFYVDFANPHIKAWTSTDITTYSAANLIDKNNFAFTFTAYDSNALNSVVITRDGTPLGVAPLGVGTGTTDGGGSYTITRTPTDNQNWIYEATFSGQAEGNYVYGIEIRDIANKENLPGNEPDNTKQYKTFDVRIDLTGPVLAFTEPADNSTVSGSKITIGGTANDALTPAGVTVWYVIDGSSSITAPSSPPTPGSPPVLAGWEQTDGSADWYKNADIPGGGEGQRYVHVVAFDALGNMSNLEHKPFYVDISPPVIDPFSFISVVSDSGVNFARGIYGFTFKAKDSNALQSVKVGKGGTPLFTATAAVSSSGADYSYTVVENSATEWTVTVNFTSQTDGNYNFTIDVMDIAGRENALTNSTPNDSTDDYKTFGVRVDTTGPVLTIVDPVANMSATGNKIYISGTAEDALTKDSVRVFYIIDSAAGTSAPATMVDAESDWEEAPGGAIWSTNADLVSGSEGARYLHVIAYDKRENPSGTVPVHREFFVDVNPPQILAWDDSASTGINFGSTPYYAGKDYTIKFNAYDSNTLAGGSPVSSQSLVKITRNGVELPAGTYGDYTLTITTTNPKTWPVTLALTNQPDGNYSYSIEIRDATGKENTLDNNTATLTDDHKSFTIVVDSTPPTTTLTKAPAMVTNVVGPVRPDNVNGVIEFAASAADNSGLDGVMWFIIPSGDSAFPPTASNAKSLYDTDGRGNLFVGNTYTALYNTTTLTDNQDYSLYILAKDKAGNVGYADACDFHVDQETDKPVVTLTNLDIPVVGSGFILRGTVKDDDGVDTGSLTISLYNGANWYTGSAWTSSTAVDIAIPGGSVTGSGREVGFSYAFPAMVDGPNHKVVVKAKDLPSSKTGSGDSAYNATNAAKTGSTGEITFDLDVTAPVITVATPIDSTYKDTAANITGTLTEKHPDVFRLRVDAGAYVTLTLSGWDSGTGTGNWTYELPIPSLGEGQHTVTLEAVDQAGLSTTVLWRFSVDKTGPVISFKINEIEYATWLTLPTGMSILREDSLALKGDFRDEYSAVDGASFAYRYDAETSSWTPTSSGVVTITNPGKTPSWTLLLDNPAPTMPDGPHRVQIQIKDALGNTTESKWIGFRVDTAEPTIIDILPTEANAVFGGVNQDPMFTLTGKAEDANLSSITLTLNGGTTTSVPVPSGAASVNFTHPVAKTVFDALPQGSNRFTITVTDEAGRIKTVEWYFIKDTEAPVIEWSNLNNQTGDSSSMFQDSNNLKIIGVARDTNGVHTLNTVIEKWNGTGWTQVEGTFDLAPNDETVKNWIKDVSTLGVNPLDGRYQITVNAVDRGGNIAAAQKREFRVDLALPAVAIDLTGTDPLKPLKNFYNGKATGSGPIVVSGTASDANGITGVTAALSGSLAPAWAAATATYTAIDATHGTWVVTIPHTQGAEELPQGGYTLNVTATDSAGRTNTAYGTFTYDSVDPLTNIDLPVKYARVTGSTSIRGSSNDNGSGVKEMYYQFTLVDTAPDTWREALSDTSVWSGGLYSWNFTFVTGTYLGTTYGTEVEYNNGTTSPQPDTGLWEVPFKVKVIDQAGNEKIIDDYCLLLDQFGDIPRIEISNPASGSILGGRVYISGTANDNNYINRIQYRVKKNPTLGSNEWDGIDWIHSTPTSGDFLTGSGIGPNVTWQFDINADGTLNPDSNEGIRPVLVQVRAVDAPQGYPNDLGGAYSDPVSVLIYFDAGVPRIGGERVANRVPGAINFPTLMDDSNSVAYVDGLQVSKYFVFEASIQDDSGLETIQYWLDGQLQGANSLLNPVEVVAPEKKTAGSFIPGRKYMIDYVGNTIWTGIGASSNTHGATFIATDPGAGDGTAYEATPAPDNEFVYKLRFMVKSDELPAYMNKTGQFTINIMALDNSSPQLRADRSYTLQVDNFYPFGAYTSPNQAAGWYNLRGTARDFDASSGPIQGLDKVVVYFSRNGAFIPLDEVGGGHSWNGTTLAVRNMATPLQTSVTFPADQYSGITIDRDEQGAGTDQDGDGYEEAWYDNGADKVWSARFNSLQLNDGPVTVHYVIFDKAGNATYYEQTVFIKNHAPVIISATLGTDIFGNKTIGGTRLYTTGYFTTPAFVARNRRLSFDVTKDGGNGAAHYRITHVTQQQVAATAIVAGEIYTIATVGATDWVAIGAASNTVGITFVATSNGGGGGGSGQAYKYVQSGGATVVKTGNFFADETTHEVLYDNFTDIPDAGDAYFLVKVWDSTVSGTWTDPLVEAQQLSDQIVIRVQIENTDAVLPTSRLYDLSPHAKNQSKYDIVTTLGNLTPDGIGEDKNMRYGGLYMENNAISGHVEPRGSLSGKTSIFLENGIPSTFDLDTVSGKVILRGYARDNQRISGIQLKFGSATAIPIITVNASPSAISGSPGHFQALIPASGVQAWVYDDLSLDEHLVEWAYEWDTQTTKLTDGGAATVVGTISVQAISLDAKILSAGYTATPYTLTPNPSATVNHGAGTAAPPTANNVNYNTISMTAAPYVTSLNRGGGYNTTRSKQGWNSFRRSSTSGTLDEQVIVNGFNLSLSGNTGAAVTLPGVTAATTTPSLTSQDRNSIRFNLPTDNVKSGVFGLAVSGIQAVNNRNNNNNTWNKEASATVEGSALWNDDRNIHVWQTNNTSSGTDANSNRGYFVGSANPIHPAMTKNPITGTLHASWSNYENVALYRGANNAGATSTFSSYDPPEHTDIHFGLDGGSANASPTIAYYLNLWGGGGWGITSVGGVDVWDISAGANYASGGNAYVAESITHDEILAHFENPRVVSRGSAIHLSYYDTDTKSLKYWYNTKGVNVTPSSNYTSNVDVTLGGVNYPNNRWINLDGGFDGNDMKGNNRVLGYKSGGNAGTNTNVAGDFAHRGPANGDEGASPLAGEFSAIDVTSDGYPVIAYYDATNQTVKLAYAQAAIPLSTTQWKRQNVLQFSDPNFNFSGRYVSMRIDTRSGMNNRIHMVFYRVSSGDLIYVTGTQASAGGAYEFQPSVIIDSVGNVGKWADISLDANGNPWVSYADSSWFDSFDAVKMAYCITSNSTTTAVTVTTLQNPDNWEVMNMPTIYSVVDKRFSIENWDKIGTGTNQQFWSAAIGYASSDYFRIGYYIKP